MIEEGTSVHYAVLPYPSGKVGDLRPTGMIYSSTLGYGSVKIGNLDGLLHLA
jgi:hypothetical protein